MLTVDSLAEVMHNAVPINRYAQLFPAVNQCLLECDCTTVNRAAMWFAQIGEESGGLKWMEELASGAEYEWRKDLGNIYAGDGIRFKGRGPIQVTGHDHYLELSEWAFGKNLVPSPTFFVDEPWRLSDDQYGFMGVTWYWTTQRRMNYYADNRDIESASVAVNGINPKTGRANGIEDRWYRWQYALEMGDRIIPVGLLIPDVEGLST